MAAASLLVAGAATLPACASADDPPEIPPENPPAAPLYGPAFSATWHDGNAELAGYRLTYPRYGAQRSGTAVAITVTEPFSWAPRVKASGDDTFGVVKLNLAEDFPTGVYDYNLMTSAFVATEPVGGLPAGAPVKVTFTAQEWCGHAFQQSTFFPGKIEHRGFSYFDGEAEEEATLRAGAGLLAEDALFLWARGLAAPAVAPGQEVEAPLLRSAAVVRLGHAPVAIDEAELEREDEAVQMDTALGRIAVREASVEVDREGAPDVEYTFWVEEAAPHRVVRWTRSDGYEAELVGVDRMPYWGMNGPGGEAALKRIGM